MRRIRIGDRTLDLDRLRPRPASFPWGSPTRPGGVAVPEPERRTGIDYDTAWSRRYSARLARAAVLEGLTRPLIHAVIPPTLEGLDLLDGLEPPAIFAANHASHLDTPLVLSVLPRRFRHRTVVAAAADYFFDTRWKSAASAFALAAIPWDRTRVSRRSADLAAEHLEDGWSLVIFPEGGRSPDRWAQPFRSWAAYLSVRTGSPLVPVHISGTGEALGRGSRRLRPGRTQVSFGRPMTAADGEDARRLAARLEAEVTALADARTTDWWQARLRAAAGQSPPLSGPEGSDWRRAWALPPRSGTGRRRSWPDLG